MRQEKKRKRKGLQERGVRYKHKSQIKYHISQPREPSPRRLLFWHDVVLLMVDVLQKITARSILEHKTDVLWTIDNFDDLNYVRVMETLQKVGARIHSE